MPELRAPKPVCYRDISRLVVGLVILGSLTIVIEMYDVDTEPAQPQHSYRTEVSGI